MDFFFRLFDVEPTFLYKPVIQWSIDDTFKKLSPIVRATKVVNDSAERALGMITNFHLDRITRSEEQKQVQNEIRIRQKGLMNSLEGKFERCTKRIIKEIVLT